MISIRTRLAAPAALVLCLAATLPAAAQPAPGPAQPGLSDEAELARAVTLYEAGRYDECVREFRELLSEDGPRRLEQDDSVEKARTYYAACLIATGKKAEASEQFREAIRKNPTLRAPDSLIFPQTVIDVFFSVRDSMMAEIKKAEEERLRKAREAAERAAERAAAERARVRRLEEYARQEVVVTKNRRWLAMVPFGVGQFQNDDPALGWIFLGTEVALAGTALGALIVEYQLNAQSDDDPRPDPVELNQALDTTHQVLVLSSWGFLAVATAGVVQAQLAFVPEVREVKKRPLPRDVRPRRQEAGPSAVVRPVPLPLPGGAGVGVVGRF